MLGLGSDDEEDIDMEDLEEQRKKLEKKAQVEKLKKQVGKQKIGLQDKIGRVLDDFAKRGSSEEKSALSILIGSAESGESTESFVIGETDDVHRSVSEFITGKDDRGRESKPFSFAEVCGIGESENGEKWFKNGIV